MYVAAVSLSYDFRPCVLSMAFFLHVLSASKLLKGMSPHIRYYNVTIIRTRGHELRTRIQSAGSCTSHLRFSAVLASVLGLHPSPPNRASSASFRVSMVVLACQRLRPSPVGYLVPHPSPFLLGSLACAQAA